MYNIISFIVLNILLFCSLFLSYGPSKTFASLQRKDVLEGTILKDHLKLIAYHGKDAEVVFCPNGYDKLCYFRRNNKWIKFAYPKKLNKEAL